MSKTVTRCTPIFFMLAIFNRFMNMSASHSTRYKTNTKMFYYQRFLGVKGDGEKKNDVIVCSKSSPELTKQHVIFFGGDVQDYAERMQAHKDNYRYLEWSLENTAHLMANRFPESLILVVKPKEMFLNTFSIYSNFVEFSETYVPILQPDTGGLVHLVKLHENVLKTMAEKQTNSEDPMVESSARKQSENINNCEHGNVCEKPSAFDEKDQTLFSVSEPDHIILVGFSKGCVVLNQFLYELPVGDSNTELKNFVSKFKVIYWLDGGHKGNKNTWVTDKDVLKNLADLNIKLFTHVTPYQVDDPMRSWIGTQHYKFIEYLKKLGADISSTKHHKNDLPTIENHFDVLNCF